MQSSLLNRILSVAAILLLLITLRVSIVAIDSFKENSEKSYTNYIDSAKTAVASANSLLSLKTDNATTLSDTLSISPFAEKRVNRPKRARSKVAFIREPLKLKGIMGGAQPLAVVANRIGKTEIVGIGDTILGRRVIKIETDAVIFRDRNGSERVVVGE
jgi:hypothetical protein